MSIVFTFGVRINSKSFPWAVRCAPVWNSVSQMWGMVVADFGRDPRSSDSLRGRFPQKNAKIANKICRSCNRHNSAMITNAENLGQIVPLRDV